MKVEIELPKELEKYKDKFIAYALEAIKAKKVEDDLNVNKKVVMDTAETAIEAVSINGKTYKKIKEEKMKENIGEKIV